jgi:hypothetical protein
MSDRKNVQPLCRLYRGNQTVYWRYLRTGDRRIIGIGRVVVGERMMVDLPMELSSAMRSGQALLLASSAT